MSSAAATPVKPKKRLSIQRRNLRGWGYASPVAAVVLVFFVGPLVLMMYMSGTDWKMAGNQGTNFPDNFKDVVSQRQFWPSILFTLKYTVIATVLLIGLGLALAMLVQESSRWRGFLRTAFLIPTSVGLASASLLFYALYSPAVGPFKGILAKFGVDAILGTSWGALIGTVFLIVWRYTGFYMLLLLVGLQGISGDLYEAARIDGASSGQIFRKITFPLLRPSLALCIIMCVTGSLLAFDQFYILTKGAPDNSTITVVYLLYKLAFETKKHLGMGAALGVIILIALVLINIFQLKVLRGDEDE
ncbi:MAG: sugar ABC transporter permease [Bifidobacteriaceae bacterium]|jgi:multiple sugar transport system permease protein|nr:sugar ABC transporter permease [Bifidobacteriaceae bacterium]